MLELFFTTVAAVVALIVVWLVAIVVQVCVILGIVAVIYVCIFKPLTYLLGGRVKDD